MLEWTQSWNDLAPVAFVIAGTFAMSLCVPKTGMSITAGFLFGTMVGSLLMTLVAVSAAVLNYLIGSVFSVRVKRLIATSNQPWIGALADVAEYAGFGLHLLFRLSPVPTMLISYAMGGLRAKWWPYLAAAIVAMGPQLLWIHAASMTRDIAVADFTMARTTTLVITVGSAVAAGVVVSKLVNRRLAKFQAAPKHARQP